MNTHTLINDLKFKSTSGQRADLHCKHCGVGEIYRIATTTKLRTRWPPRVALVCFVLI